MRVGLLVLRVLPRTLHTRSARAALRAAALDSGRKKELAHNLASMLR